MVYLYYMTIRWMVKSLLVRGRNYRVARGGGGGGVWPTTTTHGSTGVRQQTVEGSIAINRTATFSKIIFNLHH